MALSALGACVFLAGIVDALAGGGGLITLPAYLAVGMNPALVLGTNKLVSSIGTAVSIMTESWRVKATTSWNGTLRAKIACVVR